MPQLSDFTGKWSVSRQVHDTLSGGVTQFHGMAEFALQDAGLHYSESGQIVVPGRAPMKAERRYFWEQDGDDIHVAFDDGRPFHSFSCLTNMVEAAHWCPPDQYDVSYDFRDWPRWSSTWRVKGPRKDYVMVTQFVQNSG